MSKKIQIAIFASGNGTNAETIIRYFKGHDSICVNCVLCNKAGAYVLQRAEKLGVPTHLFDKEDFISGRIFSFLKERGVTHLVLAGFLWLIPKDIIGAFEGRIINIHPALLPHYGGKGMYGMKVHEAVKLAGDPETGITIHQVNEQYDEGQILFQKKVIVSPGDSAQAIATKVHALEYEHYPREIERWALMT